MKSYRHGTVAKDIIPDRSNKMETIVKTNDLLAAQIVVSKDKSRPILTGVNVRVELGHVEIAATDSYRLVVCESSQEDAVDGEVTLDLSGIKLPKNQNVKIVSNDETATIELLDGSKFSPRIIGGNFPNYRQILPSRDAEAKFLTSICFNAKYMNDLEKALHTWSGNNKLTNTIEFTGNSRPFYTRTELDNREFQAVLMPVRGKDASLKQPSDSSCTDKVSELERELNEVKFDKQCLEAEVKDKQEIIDKLKKVHDSAQDVVDSYDAVEKASKELQAENERLRAELESLKAATPSEPTSDEVMEKVDALIAKHSGIKVAGSTTCAVYFEKVRKNSKAERAIEAAGGRQGKHKKFGECWYMPR